MFKCLLAISVILLSLVACTSRETELYNQGVEFAESGHYQYAIASFDKAIELKPDYHEAYYERGNAYNINGEYSKAIDDYNKTLEFYPQYAEAYKKRGILTLCWDNCLKP